MVLRASLKVLLIILALCAIVPFTVKAAGSAADAMCNPVIPSCPCGQVPGSHGCTGGTNMYMCPCHDTTSGFTTSGICVAANTCKGVSSDGQNGGGSGVDMSSLMQALSQLMQAMQGGGGGGSGGGDTGAGQAGCTQYYTVTAPSSDPCATYVPPVSGTIDTGSATNTSGDLLNSLLGGSSGTGGSVTPVRPVATSTRSASATTTNPLPGSTILMHPVGPAAGISGDIKVTNSGATVQVNNNDTQNNSVVAGFYGANSTSEPQGLAATWCKTRPWASNFLEKIIPTTFFDSLCTLRGFPVGQLAPTRPGTARPIVRPQPRPTTTTVVASTSTRPYIPPEVNIWAVPSKVPLGARTNIYWNTKGVDTCTEASPDGSFTQNSLSGGAATVPLSGPTTYTISCITPSGDHVTNYATVNMSI